MRCGTTSNEIWAMANPTDRDEQVSVRLSATLRAELEKIAERDERTLSATIRRLVKRALESRTEGVAA